MAGQKREARLRARCPGHPGLSCLSEAKAWMPGHDDVERVARMSAATCGAVWENRDIALLIGLQAGTISGAAGFGT